VDFRCSPNNIDPIIRGDSAGNKILAGAYRILAVWNCIPTVSLRLPGRSATPPAARMTIWHVRMNWSNGD